MYIVSFHFAIILWSPPHFTDVQGSSSHVASIWLMLTHLWPWLHLLHCCLGQHDVHGQEQAMQEHIPSCTCVSALMQVSSSRASVFQAACVQTPSPHEETEGMSQGWKGDQLPPPFSVTPPSSGQWALGHPCWPEGLQGWGVRKLWPVYKAMNELLCFTQMKRDLYIFLFYKSNIWKQHFETKFKKYNKG